MLPILTPSEAAQGGEKNRTGITGFYWRKNPTLERIQAAIAAQSCGHLRSLRFTWSRPKKLASSESEFLFNCLAAAIDGAQQLANSEFQSLFLDKTADLNLLFALLQFENRVVAEFELNECLPNSMPDICTIKANFTHGHVTNQPLVGHFNEEGMILASDQQLQYLIAENAELPAAAGTIELMQLRFQTAAKLQQIPTDNFAKAMEINQLIREALG